MLVTILYLLILLVDRINYSSKTNCEDETNYVNAKLIALPPDCVQSVLHFGVHVVDMFVDIFYLVRETVQHHVLALRREACGVGVGVGVSKVKKLTFTSSFCAIA